MNHGEITRHWKNYFSIAVKGCIVGGTMLVPGVSGGSMAMILGIYSSLISAVSSFRQKKAGTFASCLCFVLGQWSEWRCFQIRSLI